MLRWIPVIYSAPDLLIPHAGPDRCQYPTELAGWHFWQDLARAVANLAAIDDPPQMALFAK